MSNAYMESNMQQGAPTYDDPIRSAPRPGAQNSGKNRYENLVGLDEAKQQRPPHAFPQRQCSQQKSSKKIILGAIAFVGFCALVVCLLVLIYVVLSNVMSALGSKSQSITAPAPAAVYTSCWHLKQSGFNGSGIYTITPRKHYPAFQVYCDMTSAGGGWTLVASVHNDDRTQKCTALDKWASPSPNGTSYSKAEGSPNWYNGISFGSISTCLNADYKSKAYYSVPATDVMISHVPNNVPVQDIGHSSFLTYHTSNQFLKQKGGSLHTFFNFYHPLNSLTIVGLNTNVLQKIGGSLFRAVTIWQNYTYLNVPSVTFYPKPLNYPQFVSTGFWVYFSLNDQPYQLVTPGTNYTDNYNYHVLAEKTQPFIVLASIANQRAFHRFRMKVVSTLTPNAVYRYTTQVPYTYKGYKILIDFGNQASYNPFFTQVFFVIAGTQKWNAANFNFSVLLKPTAGVATTNFTTEVQLENTTRSVLTGFMLLYKLNAYMSIGEITSFVNRIVDNADTFNIVQFNQAPNITVPVTFVKGSIGFTSSNVQSGFVQFQAYDTYGYSYAICPGISVSPPADPALYCIGSANSKQNHISRCGDFAAWDQLPDHVTTNRNPHTGGKFVNDLQSTLLIFSRSKNATGQL